GLVGGIRGFRIGKLRCRLGLGGLGHGIAGNQGRQQERKGKQTQGHRRTSQGCADHSAAGMAIPPAVQRSQDFGLIGSPFRRSSKYRAGERWPPLAPLTAIVSPGATQSPTSLRKASLYPYRLM